METKYTAFTFDDGPKTSTTPELLDLLKKLGINATFFLVGDLMNEETGEIVKRMISEGNNIGSHGFHHVHMEKLSLNEELDMLKAADDAISKASGFVPKYFRAPHLSYSGTLRENCGKAIIHGYCPNDWDETIPSDEIIRRVVENVDNFKIILMHDWSSKTLYEVQKIYDKLTADGYEFLTLDKLFEKAGVSPENGKIYDGVFEVS